MSMHPEIEDIAAYVEGTLPPEERTVLEAHLAECSDCRLVATDASLLVRDEIRRRRWVVAVPAAAVAAAAALALFVILPLGEDGAPATNAIRAGSDRAREALPVVAVVSPEARVSLNPDSVRFVWRSAAPEAFYRLVLTDGAGAAVWETTTSDTIAQLPPEIRLADDQHYFWYVDALLPNGTEASTGVEEFRTSGR